MIYIASRSFYYVIYSFEAKTDFPAELERRFNITENVLRSLVTVK